MKSDEIEFRYQFKDDYSPIYSNGCIGGNNCRGEVIIHFFTERNALQKSETYQLDDKGMLDGLKDRDPKQTQIIRTITSGVIMSKAQAKEFLDWLEMILEE